MDTIKSTASSAVDAVGLGDNSKDGELARKEDDVSKGKNHKDMREKGRLISNF